MRIIDSSKKIVELDLPDYINLLSDLKQFKSSFFVSKYTVKRFLVPGEQDDDSMYLLHSMINSTFMHSFNQYLSVIDLENSFTRSKNYVVTWMQDGDHFIEHNDYDGKDIDSFTLIAYLNDDYLGGELVFKDGPALKPKAGSLLIFPSSLYHSVNNVTGDRYTIMVNMDRE